MLSDESWATLKELQTKQRERIRGHLKELETDPYRPRPRADIKNCGRHAGQLYFRLRVGDWRLVYVVMGEEVRVTEIFPRGRGYRWLE